MMISKMLRVVLFSFSCALACFVFLVFFSYIFPHSGSVDLVYYFLGFCLVFVFSALLLYIYIYYIFFKETLPLLCLSSLDSDKSFKWWAQNRYTLYKSSCD